VLASAHRTLEMLEGEGWRSLMDDPVPAEGGRLGGDAVAERRESLDPFDAAGMVGARD